MLTINIRHQDIHQQGLIALYLKMSLTIFDYFIDTELFKILMYD